MLSVSTLRSRSSAIIEGASGAVARVATRSRGRRRVGAATAIAMIDVAGCGRGRPRASQTENATNTGGATDRSCRSVTWSTKRDANALTSITVTARYATAAATSARARTSVSLRWSACQVRTPSAASGTAIVSSASEPMCHAIERATSPTEYEPASPSGAYAPRSSPTPPSAMREPIHASASAPRAASVGHILRNGVVGAFEDREEAERDEDDGDEPDGLEPGGEREPDRTEQERLSAERRLPEAARERPDGEHRDRVVERFAHEQAAVDEPGDQDGQPRGDERPARSSERTRPEEDRDGGQRHEERLEQLHTRHAAAEVAADERDADDERVDEAVVRDRLAEHLEPVSGDERASQEAVELLVGRDPGGGHVAREREAEGRRCHDEDGEADDGAIDAASSHR